MRSETVIVQVLRISTENPHEDQWRLLSKYAYVANIKRFFENRKAGPVEQSTLDYIAGCVRQADAYYKASAVAPLDIEPLLLYYGTSNLLAGTSALIQAKQPYIQEHGMTITVNQGRLGDLEIKTRNPASGALQRFADVFSNQCQIADGSSWLVEEIFGSIPDLKRDFEACYPDSKSYTFPVQIVRKGERMLERIDPSDIRGHEDPVGALSEIVGFKEAYLKPQSGEQFKYIILHRKKGSNKIGTHSITGKKYLHIAHVKNGKYQDPSQVIILFMGLFALGYLSRYYPAIWNPFLSGDDTGERLVVEKFLATCRRYLPNLILNTVENRRIQFVFETEKVLDSSALESKDDDF